VPGVGGLPPPDVALVSPDTGLMDADWYDTLKGILSVGLSVSAAGATTQIDASRGGNFLILSPTNVAAPKNPSVGQVINITVRNSTGGDSTVTWDAAFKMLAWGDIPTAKTRSIQFTYTDEKVWVEISRSGDIPN